MDKRKSEGGGVGESIQMRETMVEKVPFRTGNSLLDWMEALDSLWLDSWEYRLFFSSLKCLNCSTIMFRYGFSQTSQIIDTNSLLQLAQMKYEHAQTID